MEISALSNTQIPSGQVVFGHEVRPEILRMIQLDVPNFRLDNCLSISELQSYRIKYLESLWLQLDQDFSNATSIGSTKVAGGQKSNLEKPGAKLTLGQRVADKVASFGGSWTFIISFFLFIVLWIAVNFWLLASNPFDRYPFILLNLLLSCLAAIQAPIIMMSQNRQESKDRARAKKDLGINLIAESEINMVNKKLDALLKFQKSSWMASQEMHLDMFNEIKTEIKKQKS